MYINPAFGYHMK